MYNCDDCPLATKQYKIVMVGNPNVGKSSLFYMLSGKYEEVSNYPGTSVSVSTAKIHGGTLVDTPGIYSLTNNSQLMKITKNYVNEADVIINVVNALTLDRDLALTKQLLEMQSNLVLVINQIDEAEKRGISINHEELSETLGVKIVKSIATKGIGKHEILRAILNNKRKSCHHSQTLHSPHTRWLPNDCQHIRNALDKCLEIKNSNRGISQRLDKLLLNPIFGWPILICILYMLFKVLGTVISGYLVDYLVSTIDDFYVPAVSEYITYICGNNSLFSKMLIGEFGVFTMTVKMVFGILLPLITGFYIIISLLEDSGYLPRMAALMGRFFNVFGLNGSSAIPTILGFGCGAMGTISARILETTKEKIIVTALIGMAVPCAAQQGVIISLLASLNNVRMYFVYIAVMLLVAVVSGKILSLVVKGDISHFVMDIPPLRLPSFKNCYRKTICKAKNFLSESIPIFAISSVVISVLHEYGILNWLQSSLIPIVENLLHLPKEFSDVFVMGIIRRDLASVEVLNMSQNLLTTSTQILTATIVISLFVPCINAMLVILKERGCGMALSLWLSTFVISIGVGSALTRILEMF